jgi:hypothetical protein
MMNIAARRKTFLVLCCIATPLGAHAATAITNLSGKPFDLDVIVSGTPQAVAIEPNRTWESEAYSIDVQIGARKVRLEKDARYVIWKDGTLGIQSRAKSSITHK